MRWSPLAVVVLGVVVIPWIVGGTGPAAPRSLPAAAGESSVPFDLGRAPSHASIRVLASSARVTITVVLRPTSSQGLETFDQALVDPSSGGFRQYLSESEFLARFAPPVHNRTALTAYFEGFGGHLLAQTVDGFGLTFTIPAAGFREAVGVIPESYASGPETGSVLSGSPKLPVSLARMVERIEGPAGPYSGGTGRLLAPGVPGTAPRGSLPGFVRNLATGASWYYGTDYAQAYRVNDLFPGATNLSNATYPTGEAVATILLSGFNETQGIDLPPFDPRAVGQYFTDSFPSTWPMPRVMGVPVTLGGVTPPPPGPNGGWNDSSLDQSENSLDLEMAGSMAPGASLVNFYFSQKLSLSASTGALADDFGQALASALSYNYTPARLAAVSNSYGLPDLNDSLWDVELAHAAAIGVTVASASGDQGDAPSSLTGRFQGQWPSWPATASFDASGAVSVGGVSLSIGGAPTGVYTGTTIPGGYDRNLTGISNASAWWENDSGPGHDAGTEGGLSPVYAEPAWQFNSAAQPSIARAGGLEGVGALGRAGPDIAMAANNTLAYVAADASGVYFDVLEGTSVASPLFAGELASVAAVAGHPFGFLDPELYRIGSYYAAFPSNATPYLDVTVGGNYVFSAGPGWDPTTGWGEVDAVNFLKADANASVRDYQYLGPTPGLPVVRGGGGTATPTLQLYELGAGVVISLAIAVAIVRAERSRRRASPGLLPPGTAYPGYPGPPAPYGYAPPPPPGGGPGPPMAVAPWFSCPYCGAPRPAEPVRCPACGVL
jgi:subtilase family serine protease